MKLSSSQIRKLVYENLMKGSRNHLRSFVETLKSYGAKYEPQYITKEEYNSIISSERETGVRGKNSGG